MTVYLTLLGPKDIETNTVDEFLPTGVYNSAWRKNMKKKNPVELIKMAQIPEKKQREIYLPLHGSGGK